MAKCLVFGGTGFIGSYLVDELLNKGHTVTIFTRDDNELEKEHGSLRYQYGDFMNAHDIEKAVIGQEYVFHLISLTNPAISEEDPFIDIETNVKMTIHLLESCASNGTKRVIYSSSGGSIYGSTNKISLSEEDPASPISPYAIGKQTIEGYMRYFQNKYGLDYRILRISNVYGKGQNTTNNKHGVISVFLNKILHNQPIQIYGDGSMVRDYIEVNDLVSFMATTFDQDSMHRLYNVGSGVGETVNEILTAIEIATGKKANVTYVESPSSYVQGIVLDCSRAEKEFGPITSIKIEEGIRNMLTS